MYGDLKLSFIQNSLNEYMQRNILFIERAARAKKIGVTGDGIASLAYKKATEGAGTTASLQFADYLRYVDMGVGRGHPLGGLKTVSVEIKRRNLVGNAFVKDNIRKPKKLYSKTVYGNLGSLYSQLLYGFTEETIAMLKKEIEESKNITP